MNVRKLAVLAVVLGSRMWCSGAAFGDDVAPVTGLDVIERMNARDVGESLYQAMTFELTDRRGKTRVQETESFRRFYGDDKKSALYFVAPSLVRGTAFLTYDYADEARDDDQWLYLPAMRKVRRVSSSDRGDHFLGTDLTYEDMKNESKLPAADYDWKLNGTEDVDGVVCYVIDGRPVSDALRDELGYGHVRVRVDSVLWMMRYVEFWDPVGNALKEVRFADIEEVQGVWTAHRIVARSHKTGHQTRILLKDTNYEASFNDDLFTERALRRGL